MNHGGNMDKKLGEQKMELEVLKNKDIDQAIESSLTIEANYSLVVVIDENSFQSAEAEIKKAQADKKNLLTKIKPLKQAIDDFKGKFLSKEKVESSKVDDFVRLQDAEITKYKKIKLEEQRRAKEEAERKAKEEAERIRKEQEEKLAQEKLQKEKELEAIKNSNASLTDRSSEAVRIVEEINHLESVVVPEVEIVPEKVVLKKDEISVKKVFSISDEKSFIEWALKNDLSLLQISISKSAFNEWIKKPVNQGYAFIDSKEEII
jgi:hypothetical protein